MKRLWIGIGLLAAIIILGFWTSCRMEDIHTSISSDLRRAAQAAQSEQWDTADRLGQATQAQWQESWDFSAILADHTLLDEIDGLFAQAEVYRKNRDAVRYAAFCARLSTAIDALQEAHRLSWRNLL